MDTFGPTGEIVAGVVLAAGAGERLRPLTWLRPKVLCPVAGVPLLDVNLSRFAGVVDPGAVAVNVHHHREALESHIVGRHPHVHVSVEARRPLGTAGAIGRLRDWIGGRSVLVVNGDAWTDVPLGPLLDGWDGERPRVLVPGGAAELGPTTPVAGTLVPAAVASALRDEPAGLYGQVWAPAMAAGRLELVSGSGLFVDCGTPAAYVAANLAASGGRSVVDETATVEDGARLVRSVVWPGAAVHRSEMLVDAVRAGSRVTVLVRGSGRAGPPATGSATAREPAR